jgi:hypothetical protein
MKAAGKDDGTAVIEWPGKTALLGEERGGAQGHKTRAEGETCH